MSVPDRQHLLNEVYVLAKLRELDGALAKLRNEVDAQGTFQIAMNGMQCMLVDEVERLGTGYCARAKRARDAFGALDVLAGPEDHSDYQPGDRP